MQLQKVPHIGHQICIKVYNIYACSGILFNQESHITKLFCYRKLYHQHKISLGSNEKPELGDLSVVRVGLGS